MDLKKYVRIIIITTILITGLTIYLMLRKVSPSLDFMQNKIELPEESYSDPSFCRQDSDCKIFHENCESKVVNKYHFDSKLDEKNLAERPSLSCRYFNDLTNPRCEANKCVAD